MTGENGYPVTPDWQPDPRPWPEWDSYIDAIFILPPDMPDCWLGEN